MSNKNGKIEYIQNIFRKVAIFRALQLGDLLCIIPAIRAFKRAYPSSQLYLIGLPWAKLFVERFSNYFSGFIKFPGYPGLPEQSIDLKEITNFFKKVQKEQFDVLLQMHGDGTITNPLCMMFGAKEIYGCYLPGQYCPSQIHFMPYQWHEHEIWRHLKLMEFLGIPLQGDYLEFPLTKNDFTEFKSLAKKAGLEKGNYMCIHPGARDSKKRWSEEKFAFIADAFAKVGIKVALTGTKEEMHISKNVEQKMKYKAINLVGKTTLGSLAVLIKNSLLLISNDTSVSHIASALNVPSIVIFLTTDPNRWSPLNKDLHRTVMFDQANNPKHVLVEIFSLIKDGFVDLDMSVGMSLVTFPNGSLKSYSKFKNMKHVIT